MKSSVLASVLLALTCFTELRGQIATVEKGQNQAAQVAGTPITIGETWRIKSARLDEAREVRVYLPSSYASSKQRYPVIYTLDGEGTGSVTANAVGFMTSYSELPQMPEALVVAITNTDRNRDMPVPQEYGMGRGEEKFLAFLGEEIIPVIEQKYRTQPLRILIGHSQGGLFTYYAMTAKPALFQWYLPIDAPLSGFPLVKPIMEKVRTLINKTPNYRGRLVAVENLYGWLKEWPSLTPVDPKSVYIARVEIKDETHETMAYRGIYEGLKRLFHDYAPDTKDAKLPELEIKYQALSEAYGYQVDIPQQVLLRSASRNVQDGAEAAKLIERAVTLYGASPATKRLMAAAAEAAKQGGPDPRLTELPKLPPPDVEKMKPFLGKWERITADGAHWYLTFEVRDGMVKTRYAVTPPSAPPFELEVAFTRVLDGPTVQWGERNGKGPGIMIYTAKLVDQNRLKGETEGVGFLGPVNAQGPRQFTFTRLSDHRNQAAAQRKVGPLTGKYQERRSRTSPAVVRDA